MHAIQKHAPGCHVMMVLSHEQTVRMIWFLAEGEVKYHSESVQNFIWTKENV